MNKEALKKIFEFLEEKESKFAKSKGTLLWKLAFNEPLTEKDLNIKGGLFLHHSNITSLPEGLKVGGDLNLTYTVKLESLPSNLDVKGDLNLHGSNITSLPEGLKVGGSLDLSYSNITSLPEGLKVGGWLDLSHTDIEFLPKGLKVVGDLDLRHTKISSLPKGLKVGGDLLIFGTPINEIEDNYEIREMIKPGFIKGEILE
jgi:hypothetical protein